MRHVRASCAATAGETAAHARSHMQRLLVRCRAQLWQCPSLVAPGAAADRATLERRVKTAASAAAAGAAVQPQAGAAAWAHAAAVAQPSSQPLQSPRQPPHAAATRTQIFVDAFHLRALWQLRHIPGPPPVWLLGNLLDVRAWGRGGVCLGVVSVPGLACARAHTHTHTHTHTHNACTGLHGRQLGSSRAPSGVGSRERAPVSARVPVHTRVCARCTQVAKHGYFPHRVWAVWGERYGGVFKWFWGPQAIVCVRGALCACTCAYVCVRVCARLAARALCWCTCGNTQQAAAVPHTQRHSPPPTPTPAVLLLPAHAHTHVCAQNAPTRPPAHPPAHAPAHAPNPPPLGHWPQTRRSRAR
jgi:hypothetical protein